MKTIGGLHLLIDGYVRDGNILNPDTLTSLFDRLVETLGMQYLQRPTSIRVTMDPAKLETHEDDGGWSVICQITTSHISLHGWPMRGAFMMDIFSCVDFDADKARSVVKEVLDVTHWNVQQIRRMDPERS